MKSIKSSRQVPRVLRGVRGIFALAGIVLGLTAAGCGAGGAPVVAAPPASGHTAAERAAVMNWLAATSQMWTHSDFAAVDQITTGQMRTIYLSEEPQASLPGSASRQPFQLTNLSITIPCHSGSPAVFVAYADTDVFDLWNGMQSAAMVFERVGGQWKLAAALTQSGGSGWPDGISVAAPRPVVVHRETDTFTTAYAAIDPLHSDNATVVLDGFFGWPLTATAS